MSESERAPSVRIREACGRCKRVTVRHSRRGYTWKCPHCDYVNAGPGLRDQDPEVPSGTRRRVARREAAAEARAERGTDDAKSAGADGGRPAPAPVRRRRAAPAAAAASSSSSSSTTTPPAASAAEGTAPAKPANTRRPGLFERLMWGGDE